jgi:hypothetical protein
MENANYDTLVIELQKGDQSMGAISIKKSDIDLMTEMHGQTIETIVGDMAKTLEKAVNDMVEKNSEDGKSEE